MSTRFVQPKGGLTNNNNDMTFEFAGDDDVWVFIDDVLVGDIGGIHNRASLSINFHTGDIKVNDNYNGTLKSKYQEAGKAGDTSWEGNTFADDTNHTLKFFYLERGATDSNMELKFNLVTVPESDIIKFDQDGKFVQSAEFALYKTDENFTDTTNDKNALLGSGTTDEAGHLTLTNDDDNGVINFDDLYNKNHGNKYYLLKETRVPEDTARVSRRQVAACSSSTCPRALRTARAASSSTAAVWMRTASCGRLVRLPARRRPSPHR